MVTHPQPGETMRTSNPTRHNDAGTAIAEATHAIESHLIAIRRDLHAHPELAFEEVRTAGVVAAELARLGIPHQTQVGRTGVVGTIVGGRPGPTLAIRADMDALPIQERTGQAFASTVEGKMHACGHDIHTSTLLGVAAVLAGMAPQLSGTVRLLFQPAEEAIGGAAAMIADGALEGVDMALGFHNAPGMPTGRFGYTRGASLAAADRIEFTVTGVSGHAAHPYSAVDPIVAACHLVTQLQTVVSREQRPIHPCVVTIGAIHAGTANNIIPDACVLRGTVRTLHEAARNTAEASIGRLCAGIEVGMRVKIDYVYTRGAPSLVNDDGVLDRLRAAVEAQFGAVIDEGEPSMGAEDFALMSQLVPAAHLRVGASQPGRRDKLHNSDYQPDEGSIRAGVQALSRAALEMLS